MSGFHYTEFSKTGSILLNAEEKEELFDYIDRLKAENVELQVLVRDLWHELDAATQYEAGGSRGIVFEFADAMRKLGIVVDA